jgi:hypothetical protein
MMCQAGVKLTLITHFLEKDPGNHAMTVVRRRNTQPSESLYR